MVLDLNPWAVGMKFSELGLEGLVDLARRHGFGAVDLPMEWVRDEAEADRAAEVIQKAGMEWGMFYPPCDFFSEKADVVEGLRALGERAKLASRAGCRLTYNHVYPGSNTRGYGENLAWHRERCKQVAEVLGGFGVKYAVEFLGPVTMRQAYAHAFVHTLEGALEMVDGLGEGVGVALDMFHFYTGGGEVAALAGVEGRRIFMVHANDGQAGRAREEQMNLERAMPGENGLVDGRGILRALVAGGFSGPVFAEPFSPMRERFAAMDLEAVAAETMRSLRRIA